MNRFQLIKVIFYSLLLFIALNGCHNNNDSTVAYQPEFAVDTAKQNSIVMGFPNFSYSETSAPMVEYLNAHLSGNRIKVHACVDWDEYVSFLNQGKFDLTIINGIVATEAIDHGYSIVGKITSDDPYSSLIITRKNLDISKATDLKGKKVAMVPSHIIPATMMGMYYLFENGLNVNLDIHTESVASFEATILSVYLGKSDAGICTRRNWNIYIKEHPEILSKVEIKWETPPLIHNAVLIKNTVDEKVKSQLMKLFFSMRETNEGRAALERININGFEKADNHTYKSMLDFKKKYDAVIL